MDADEFTVLCTDIDCVADGLLSTDFETLSQQQQVMLRSRLQDLFRAISDFETLGLEALCD